jgi:putative tricarboxylic transport membrane protein
MFTNSRFVVIGILISVGMILAGSTGVAAAAAAYPTKQIEFVVHTNPGDSVHIFASAVAQLLNAKKIVTQPIVVVTKAGGSSAVAYAFTAQKKGDPYFLQACQPSALTTPIIQNLNVTWRQFTPVANVYAEENILVVKKDSKIRDLKDMIAAAKKAEKAVSIGGGVFGAGDSMVTYLLEKEYKVKFNFVSFRGAGESMVALLGGNIDVLSCNPSEAIGQVQAGTVRVLGVTSEKRSPFLPDVPTLIEQGSTLGMIFSFRGILMPGGVSAEVVKYWNDAIKKMRETKEWKDILLKSTCIDDYLDNKKFAAFLEEKEKFYQSFLTEMGLKKK